MKHGGKREPGPGKKLGRPSHGMHHRISITIDDHSFKILEKFRNGQPRSLAIRQIISKCHDMLMI